MDMLEHTLVGCCLKLRYLKKKKGDDCNKADTEKETTNL